MNAKEKITYYEDVIDKIEKDKQETLASRRRWYQLLEVNRYEDEASK